MAKYVVAYIGIDSGEVEDVYEADEIGEVDRKATQYYKKGEDLDSINTLSSKSTCIMTHYTHNSPGCRVVPVGRSWYVVCG